ncbi:repressor LexA [Butyrivibrio hungatei DSM 14810]|uniref:Repressor LexA n=1 Tax=Butyrivibrio hungatei DSM 14810 TaxID=1121132 RepID=A0A1M7RQ28_9FIRM|nr:transcriptional repressor LexA [Butyrivibrio hungatei]SHN48405.1 repressor LexA [Butyrivibrio hungatei DSM 14810]
MRHKSTELMEKIQSYVENYYKEYRHSPSTTDIADAVGIARGTAYKYLVAMSDNGMIRYDGQQISTEKTEKVQTEFTSVALLGSVSCGVPTLEEEYAEEFISLPVSMFGKGTFFMLRASGESMIDAGISTGDLVLVRKQSEAKDGDIVVALVENENTLKRYFVDTENNQIRLHPENKNMKDIIVQDCKIQGVAVKVIKDLA